jgi:hypothetical protein
MTEEQTETRDRDTEVRGNTEAGSAGGGGVDPKGGLKRQLGLSLGLSAGFNKGLRQQKLAQTLKSTLCGDFIGEIYQGTDFENVQDICPACGLHEGEQGCGAIDYTVRFRV